MSTPASLVQALEALRQGRRWPAILIHGNSAFLVRESADKILDILLPEPSRAIRLEIFDGSMDPAEVVAALQTYPLIPGAKVVWVREAAYFHSKNSVHEMLDRAAQAHADGRSERAMDLALKAVAAAGWELADVAHGEWRRISDAAWREQTGFERDVYALAWFDAVLDGAEAEGRDVPSGDESVLERALVNGWPEGHLLMLSATLVDRRMNLYKGIAKAGLVLNCSVETRFSKDRKEALSKSREGLMDRLRELGKRIRPDALRALEDRIGPDPGHLSREIEKLAAYAGPSEEVAREDVEAVVETFGETALYELNAAVTAGETSKGFSLARALLDSGRHPLAIVASLGNEIRKMIRCREAIDGPLKGFWRDNLSFGEFESKIVPVLNSSGIEFSGHPYAQYQTYLTAGRTDGRRWLKIHTLLLEADLALKSEGSRLALDRLLLSCGKEIAPRSGAVHD